jgi:hypothetical protein
MLHGLPGTLSRLLALQSSAAGAVPDSPVAVKNKAEQIKRRYITVPPTIG